MQNVENKIVIITGASSGIGEATALLLAKHGAKVVLAARRTERLEQIAALITSEGGTAQIQAVDVRSRKDVHKLVDFTKERFGRVDVIFNNAGIMPLSPMSELKVDEWENMVDINIKGVLNGIAAGLPVMQAQGGGHFINTASIGAHAVSPTAAVYCATKYAVWAISEGLRQESTNIRVTTISPGVTTTELGDDISDAHARDQLKQWRKTSLSADAIARGVLYAISQPDDVDVNELIIRPTASAF